MVIHAWSPRALSSNNPPVPTTSVNLRQFESNAKRCLMVATSFTAASFVTLRFNSAVAIADCSPCFFAMLSRDSAFFTVASDCCSIFATRRAIFCSTSCFPCCRSASVIRGLESICLTSAAMISATGIVPFLSLLLSCFVSAFVSDLIASILWLRRSLSNVRNSTSRLNLDLLVRTLNNPSSASEKAI